MLAAAPKIADDAARAAIEPGVHFCRGLDHRQRVELVELSVQQRRLDAVNIFREHAHSFCFLKRDGQLRRSAV